MNGKGNMTETVVSVVGEVAPHLLWIVFLLLF